MNSQSSSDRPSSSKLSSALGSRSPRNFSCSLYKSLGGRVNFDRRCCFSEAVLPPRPRTFASGRNRCPDRLPKARLTALLLRDESADSGWRDSEPPRCLLPAGREWEKRTPKSCRGFTAGISSSSSSGENRSERRQLLLTSVSGWLGSEVWRCLGFCSGKGVELRA